MKTLSEPHIEIREQSNAKGIKPIMPGRGLLPVGVVASEFNALFKAALSGLYPEEEKSKKKKSDAGHLSSYMFSEWMKIYTDAIEPFVYFSGIWEPGFMYEMMAKCIKDGIGKTDVAGLDARKKGV